MKPAALLPVLSTAFLFCILSACSALSSTFSLNPTADTFVTTPSLTAEILSGSTLSLRMFAADNALSPLADSRNFSNTSLRPQLSVSVIVEPGTVALGFLSSSLFFC